jgi:xylose isomerase
MKYFTNVGKISYEGPQSKNPYAFKYYNPEEIVGGKTMGEQLRFAVAYWHTFTGEGVDPFGTGTMIRPWDTFHGLDKAKARVEAAFEFFEKLNVPFFTFHDRDIAPEGNTLQETNKNLDIIIAMIKDHMKTSKTKVLWNTANMFSHPRYVHGAATSCNADVFAYCGAQIKKGLETGKELDTPNYVFWGGREGYETLLNTDVDLELNNMARLFRMAVDYAQEIGYNGQFLIEPKPKEPTKHQYDFDAQSVIAFLRRYDLAEHFKLNIEANHATLAGHNFQHELRIARVNGALGSVDANQGDALLGWDTDEFPTDIYETTMAMYEIMKNGGLGKGGLNFDAKPRRGSFEPEDLFLAHIAGMDSFAKGLKVADRLIGDQVFEIIIDERYGSYKEGIGLEIVSDRANLHTLEAYALKNKPIINKSGRQEHIKAVLNQYLFR